MIEYPRPYLKFLSDHKDLVGCEIGVADGSNTMNMFKYLSIKHLYLIDSYDVYNNKVSVGIVKNKEEGNEWKKKAHDKLYKYKDKITWFEDLSENVHDQVPNNLDFLYVDGCHRFEYIMKDLNLYVYKVKIGGLIIMHDFDYHQVKTAAAVYFEPIKEKYNIDFRYRVGSCLDGNNEHELSIIKDW